MNKTVQQTTPQTEDNKPVLAAETEIEQPSRREFLSQTLTAASGLAISGALAATPVEAQTPTPPKTPTCAPSQNLTTVGSLRSNQNVLQAVLKVKNEARAVLDPNDKIMLRYFEGTYRNKTGKWPVKSGVIAPGPTFRAELGDSVQITFLNQVDVSAFGQSLDAGERGEGCDRATATIKDPKTGVVTVDPNWYPKNDQAPDCFNGSSTANIHFHGAHVSPSAVGDNILVGVRPNPAVSEDRVGEQFKELFDHCLMGHEPKKWDDLPTAWTTDQKAQLQDYDKNAPYTGPGRNPNGHGLPDGLKLWPQDEEAIKAGIWPQWYIGSYPYCFKFPKYAPGTNGNPPEFQMGQAPGTHWYHAHKHGSTAINLFNGLSGAFIVTDNSPTGYDGKFRSLYGGRMKEHVLIFQQITAVVNLMSATGGPRPVLVNGDLQPTIEMNQGEVQMWRMVNATVSQTLPIQFTAVPNSPGPPPAGAPPLQFKQIAQDGVQFAWESYQRQPNGTPITMMPGNRVDILVQAPTQPGCYVLGSYNAPADKPPTWTSYISIRVNATKANPPMNLPATAADFPTMPVFLKDIDAKEVKVRRELSYGWEATRTGPGRDANNAAPVFNIDGKQFKDQVIDQVMLRNSVEEWTIYNHSSIPHPFHIHVNPFQIVEVFDPTNMHQPLKLTPPYVWWDTFGIPPALYKKDNNGKQVLDPVTGLPVFVPGYFKMRTRFADFTGIFVNHCHILAHEDRGMMQLIEVVDNRTIIKHH